MAHLLEEQGDPDVPGEVLAKARSSRQAESVYSVPSSGQEQMVSE